jgi:hypothetical protein
MIMYGPGGKNGAVRARTVRCRVLLGGLGGALVITGALAGCGSDPVPAGAAAPSASAVPTEPTEARDVLAARAAAAKDRRMVAFYTLSTTDRADRTVTVTRAVDGGWRVDIPGGALDGTADVAVARTREGLFQCELPSAQRPVGPSCVRVSGPKGRLAAAADPRVQHVFVDWLDVLTDRGAAIAVTATRPLPGVRGSCFSVETNAASLAAPLDVGIYCYDRDGTLTGARLGFGTLMLAGAPAAAPPAVTLPGPVVGGEPLPMVSPTPTPSTT